MTRIQTVTQPTREDALASAEATAANIRAGGESVTIGKVYEVVAPKKYGQISVELVVGGPETETNATDPVVAAIVYDDPGTNAESTALTSDITSTESGLVLPNGVEADSDDEDEVGAEVPFDEVQAPAKGHLPDDFPGYAPLVEAGVNTYGQLRKVDDLTSIAGIGPATATRIKDALAASDTGE